jgi:ubiquinone/menaquinone biosynthesis C-methylase UbiE
MSDSTTDPFPPSEFDTWAENYDQSISASPVFPFDGYEQVLDAVVTGAEAHPGQSVLDLGTGTGNLALRFADIGCALWCTDFSEPMLAKARQKLRKAQFFLHDLRQDWPDALSRRFDRIVSAYVFHHFELPKKLEIVKDLAANRLSPGGRLVIADLSFPNRAGMDAFARSVGDLWDDEFYWLVDESLAAFADAGLRVGYVQVSACAGVYTFKQ